MLDKDYHNLIAAYEKLNAARPDMYILSYDDQIERLKKRNADERYLKCQEQKKVEISIFLLADDCSLMKYYHAFQNRDMKYLNDVLYETAHLEQIGNISDTGTDHGFYGMRITPNLMAANMFDRLKLVLPEENGLGTYAFVGTNIANLLMGICYENPDMSEEAGKRAYIALQKKNPEYIRYHIECMLAILEKNAEEFNRKINLYCKAFLKAREFGLNDFNKGFCIEAHGMYNLAKWAYNGLMKSDIKMPTEKNFCQDLAEWQEENGKPVGHICHVLPDELEIYNRIKNSKPVQMHLKKVGRKMYLDTERAFDDYLAANAFY